MLRRALYHGSERASQERGTPAWLRKMGRVSTDSRQRQQGKRRHGRENKEGEFIWNTGDKRGESVPSGGLGLSQIQRLCGQSGLRHADPNISMAFHSNGSFSCTWHVCGGPVLTAPCTPCSRAQDPGWRSSSSLGYCQSPTREKTRQTTSWFQKWHMPLRPTFHWPTRVHVQASHTGAGSVPTPGEWQRIC